MWSSKQHDVLGGYQPNLRTIPGQPDDKLASYRLGTKTTLHVDHPRYPSYHQLV